MFDKVRSIFSKVNSKETSDNTNQYSSKNKEFSMENFMDYGSVGCRLADDLEGKWENGLTDIIIPSRGAIPFYIAFYSALRECGKLDKDYKDFYKKIKNPRLIEEYTKDFEPKENEPKIEKDDTISSEKNKINVLLCPFTADLNLQKYDPKSDNTEFSKEMRRYWVKVTSAFSKGIKERVRDPYFNFYIYLIKEVEGRKSLANDYAFFRRIEKPAMIDTVISGLASSTIFNAAQEEGKLRNLSYHLVIDRNGERLRKEYKQILGLGEVSLAKDKNIHCRNSKVSPYLVNNIFTEDRGAGLLGVVGVIYPSLLCMGKELSKISPLGVGSWYNVGEEKEITSFKHITKAINHAVRIHCSGFCDDISKEKEEEELEKTIGDLNKFIDEKQILSPSPSSIQPNKVYKPEKVYVTSSHVNHICFSEDQTRSIFKDFEKQFKEEKIFDFSQPKAS